MDVRVEPDAQIKAVAPEKPTSRSTRGSLRTGSKPSSSDYAAQVCSSPSPVTFFAVLNTQVPHSITSMCDGR